MRASIFIVALAAAHVAHAQATYSPWTREAVRPSFALSAGSDGAISGKASVNVAWDGIFGTTIHTFSFAPAFSITDRANTPFFTIGSSSATPDFGANSISAGLMIAYTYSPSTHDDIKVITESRLQDQAIIDACKVHCGAAPLPLGDDNKPFCDQYGAYMTQFRAGTLPVSPDSARGWEVKVPDCPDFRKSADMKKRAAVLDNFAKGLRAYYRFPVLDVSAWGGGGGARFDYYLQTPATATYTSTSAWNPSGQFAFELVSVPPVPTDSLVGLSIEIPLVYKSAYQASKTTGSACKALGTLASSPGSMLSSCSPAEAIGAPRLGTNVTLEFYVGVVDRWNGIWRAALGGSYSHDEVTGLDTWSIKLPFYVNGSVLTGSKNDSETKPPVVTLDYSGVVRLTPTFQTTPGGQTPGWAMLLSLELLGQRNLFPRADVLIK
jgi:hypothetical protein